MHPEVHSFRLCYFSFLGAPPQRSVHPRPSLPQTFNYRKRFFASVFFLRLLPRTFLPVRCLRTRHMSNVRLGRSIKNSLRGTPTVRDNSRTALTQSAAVGSRGFPPDLYPQSRSTSASPNADIAAHASNAARGTHENTEESDERSRDKRKRSPRRPVHCTQRARPVVDSIDRLPLLL